MTELDGLETEELYYRTVSRRILVLTLLSTILAILFILSLSIGTATLSLGKVLEILSSALNPSIRLDPLVSNIIWSLRLPRILMAIVAGASFGIAGSILQTILRNPLASPYTIGVASSSAFGAALAIILGAGFIGWRGSYIVYYNPYVIVVNAFISAMLCTSLISILAFHRNVTPSAIVLSGIALTYLFSAATSLLQYFGTTEQIAALVFWVFGDLGKADWFDVEATLTVFAASSLLLYALSKNLDAMILGDEVALSLGVNLRAIRILVLLLAALLTATPIAFIGTIGFIGLLAPHIARFLLGPAHRYLIPGSALTGAILLLVADTVSRTIISPLILPVGILTAFMGVPLFLYLLFTRGIRYW